MIDEGSNIIFTAKIEAGKRKRLPIYKSNGKLKF